MSIYIYAILIYLDITVVPFYLKVVFICVYTVVLFLVSYFQTIFKYIFLNFFRFRDRLNN